jgi:hypothetical protein
MKLPVKIEVAQIILLNYQMRLASRAFLIMRKYGKLRNYRKWLE